MALMANKQDLIHIRAVQQEKHNQFADENDLYTYCVSARTGDPVPMALLTITTLIAWIAGFLGGNGTYASYVKPYYDINNLNVYPIVDVQRTKGSQLMDAGIVNFDQGSQLVLPKSIGFKNEDIYCVVPIAKVDPKTHTIAPMDTYDFWAVGTNCCSGHIPDFHCGEYSNPMAHYGLRLLDDDAREMYRLAVQEAEAAYNLKADHPIFVNWVQDPYAEVNALSQDGNNQFFGAIGMFCGIQLAVVVGLAACIAYLPQA